MTRRYRTIAALAAALLLPLGLNAAEPAKPAAPAAESAVDAKTKKAEPKCESTATTRIRKMKSSDCAKDAVGARTYSKEELERTGEIEVGEALRKLDPRFH
jgi:hypothetical protein